jgi:hypothetical protein
LRRGHRTSPKATRIETSGSRGFTRKSKSTTVPQLQLIADHECFAVIAAASELNRLF